jgi:hypothetical protein
MDEGSKSLKRSLSRQAQRYMHTFQYLLSSDVLFQALESPPSSRPQRCAVSLRPRLLAWRSWSWTAWILAAGLEASRPRRPPATEQGRCKMSHKAATMHRDEHVDGLLSTCKDLSARPSENYGDHFRARRLPQAADARPTSKAEIHSFH